MFDGKVVNALTDTKYTQKCNICRVTSANVNNIEYVRNLDICEMALKLGLSSLHCWIRSFEYILHLGYKMENKAWQARTEQQKISVSTRKKRIQTEFYEKLSLIVDQPKVGFGNSNDGNTARRAFANAAVFSEITGVSIDVIIRLQTVLRAICSGQRLNIKHFQSFCSDTLDKVIEHITGTQFPQLSIRCWYMGQMCPWLWSSQLGSILRKARRQ